MRNFLTNNRRRKYLFFCAVGFAIAGCGQKVDDRSDAEASAIAPVKLMTVADTSSNQSLNLSGTIQADKIAQITFTVQGKVISVLADEGQHVNKGQLLATLDPRDYQYQLEQAEASLLQAKDNYLRNKQLFESGSLTPKEFVASQSQYLSSLANQKTAGKRVSDTRLYAPISGTVTQKATEVGAQASAQGQAFTIANIDKVNAVMTIPETAIGNIMIDNTAQISVPSINQMFTGKVTSINPQADKSSNTFRIKIQLNNMEKKLLPGMIAEINLVTNNKVTYIEVPPKAVVTDEDGLSYIFLFNKSNSQAVRRRITTGQAIGEEITITDGLKNGEQIIIEGQTTLKDGQKVQVK